MAKIRLLFVISGLFVLTALFVPRFGAGQEPLDPSKTIQEALKRYNVKESQSAQTKEGPFLYLFFSFGMPEGSIHRMAEDAEKAGAIMVLRGFVNDSGRETRAAMFKFGKEHKAELDIDPTVFRKFKIDQVPAVVLVKKICPKCQEAQPENEFIKVSGDVSLSYALEDLERNYPAWHTDIEAFQKRLETRR